jgi:hypothetical protein
MYLRYAYHRYCHEREDGQADAADAVLEGLVDVATRRFGPHRSRRRWTVPVLRCMFDAARRLKPSRGGGAPMDARKDLFPSADRGTRIAERKTDPPSSAPRTAFRDPRSGERGG